MKSNCQRSSISGLRLARFLRNISQDELGAIASVDQATVSRAERGFHISPAARRKIVIALGLPEEVVFPETEERRS